MWVENLGSAFPPRIKWVDLECVVRNKIGLSLKNKTRVFYFYLVGLILFPTERSIVPSSLFSLAFSLAGYRCHHYASHPGWDLQGPLSHVDVRVHKLYAFPAGNIYVLFSIVQVMLPELQCLSPSR
ncbi:hypothetical protein AMTRI_Chr10g410 [Amborella trichopoda]